MKTKKGKRDKITSGDKLTDWFFNRIIQALNKKVDGIFIKKVLRSGKGKTRIEFYGYFEDGEIYLSAAKTKHKNREAMAKTLLHEAAHAAFSEILERNIRQLEEIIWKKLSLRQKSILRSYLPRHLVISYPEK